MVRGRRGEAIFVERGTDFFGCLAEISGEFDFLVTDLGDAGDGAVEVLLHELADGVQLEPDAIDVVDGTPGWPRGGSDDSSGDSGFDECSSVHGGKSVLLSGPSGE